MNAKPGSSFENAIRERTKIIVRPPQPFPQNCKLIELGKIEVPTLPLFHYSEKPNTMRKYFTFIVMGEIGSGKTTLLDVFVNYLNKMDLKDNWRWKLVDESHLNIEKERKTSEMSIYYINDKDNKFNIRIIDTPGFGNPSDDNEDILARFEQLFHTIPEIDYILFTIRSFETELKPGSKLIYDKIKSLFGTSSKNRFIPMCTFADDKTPNCLNAIKSHIPFEKYFAFNNSAIYNQWDKGNKTT